MSHQIDLPDSALAEDRYRDHLHLLQRDIAYQRILMVNVIYLSSGCRENSWVLVDAGLAGSAGRIKAGARSIFGERAPEAIVLTHGHFDHVGALIELAEQWQVPIFAHPEEFQFLNGQQSYPPPDPTAGGGLMSALSVFYPRDPIDVSKWLQALPADGSIPCLPDWKWIASPGHTPGHISLWRESDRTLIAGDAVITTNQESAYAVATQEFELHGPPMYFTPDWRGARRSVEQLAALEPELLLSGHGRAAHGEQLREALHDLVQHFDEVALPRRAVEQSKHH